MLTASGKTQRCYFTLKYVWGCNTCPEAAVSGVTTPTQTEGRNVLQQTDMLV